MPMSDGDLAEPVSETVDVILNFIERDLVRRPYLSGCARLALFGCLVQIDGLGGVPQALALLQVVGQGKQNRVAGCSSE